MLLTLHLTWARASAALSSTGAERSPRGSSCTQMTVTRSVCNTLTATPPIPMLCPPGCSVELERPVALLQTRLLDDGRPKTEATLMDDLLPMQVRCRPTVWA